MSNDTQQLIESLAAETGVPAADVARMAERVVEYVAKHYDGTGDLADYVVAGIMHDRAQRRRMAVRCLTRPQQAAGAVLDVLNGREQ